MHKAWQSYQATVDGYSFLCAITSRPSPLQSLGTSEVNKIELCCQHFILKALTIGHIIFIAELIREKFHIILERLFSL
jgi:hypothetical protein